MVNDLSEIVSGLCGLILSHTKDGNGKVHDWDARRIPPKSLSESRMEKRLESSISAYKMQEQVVGKIDWMSLSVF